MGLSARNSKAVRFAGVRAVLFDIDDTLFPSSEFSALARKNAVSAMVRAGLKTTASRAQTELNHIISARGSNFSNHFDLLSKRFPCPDRFRVVAAGVAAYHNTKSSISPYPNVAETLLELRSGGYVLAVASEGLVIKQWDKLIRLGLDSLFHKVFVTSSVGNGKNAAFYKRVARSLHLPPSSILMVGDNPEKDILPAKKAGMHTIRIIAGKHAKSADNATLRLRTISGLVAMLPKSAAK